MYNSVYCMPALVSVCVHLCTVSYPHLNIIIIILSTFFNFSDLHVFFKGTKCLIIFLRTLYTSIALQFLAFSCLEDTY